MDLHLYKALVVDTEDSDKQGKIKIKILPYMENLEDSLLPWAIPFGGRFSSSSLSNRLPEKESTVRVLVDTYWKRFFYLENPYFYNLFDYSTIEGILDKAKDSNENSIDKSYNDIEFTLYEEGGLSFHNRKDGTHGFIHKSGSFTVFDKNGSIICEAPNQTITLSNATDTLGSLLEELINDLSELTTVGSPTTQTSPTLKAQMKTLLPKIKKLLK